MDRCRMNRPLFVLFACFMLTVVSTLNASESYLSNSAMYADTSFEKEQYKFSTYDKMYLVLDFINLPPGQHDLIVDWLTPFGNLERQTSHTITSTDKLSSHRIYFWLKLIKRGPLKRTLTGQEYKEEFYGEWKVNFYLNSLPIGWKSFEVY